MMNIRFPALAFTLALSGPAVRGQTLSEALDTPDRTWTPVGSVTALNDPALAHDGVDSVRLDLFRSPETGVFESSIATELAVPSVMEFWHRSRDLDGVTVLGINNLPFGNSSVWKFQQAVAAEGRLEISNKGEPGAGPLYLDSVSVRPAALVSLAEALDWSAPVGRGQFTNPGTALGLAEAWLAPDGVDAVYFSQTGTYIQTTVSGPALLSFRSRDAKDNLRVQALSSVSPEITLFPEFTVGDRTWFRTPAAGVMYFKVRPDAAAPVVMDGLETVPPVPVGEALDAPALGLTLSGYATGTSRIPAGATDGDAVLCLEDRAPGDPTEGPNSGRISLNVNGPAVVRFEYLGTGVSTADGIPALFLNSAIQPESYNPTAWRTAEMPVYRASQVVSWTGNLWINAVSVHPLPPGLSPGALLDAPDVVPEFPIPAQVMPQFSPVARNGQEQGLVVVPVPTPEGTVPAIRLPFQGPSVLSLWVSPDSNQARLRIDGGPWQAKPPRIWEPGEPFMAVVPGAGAHFLEVSGPAFMDQFRVVPLEELPLAEALGAPELVFTTSPGTPWKGYKVPEGLDKRDNRAATGGQHAVEADPWIETTVNGPGVLGFKIRSHSVVSAGFPAGTADFPPRMSIDGGAAEAVTGGPGGSPSEFFLGAGPHTVRWIQKGSRAGEPPSTMAWLDGVSFKPGTITASEALDTPGRSWTLGGSGGEALPLAMATGSPDGVDSVRMQSTSPGGSGWVETVVNLPARISFSGSHQVITNGAGELIFNQGTAAASSFQLEVKGAGPARLRFSHTPGQPGVLDKVMISESAGRIASTAVLPSGTRWKRLDEKPWAVLENPGTGETIFQAGNPFWIEGTVMGPCMLGVNQEMTLPDHGNRKVFNGMIPYPGPQRVLMVRRNGNPASAQFLVTDGHRPALDLGEAMGGSGITWSTGGDAVWLCPTARLAYSPTLWPGETSWIEAAVTGPGVLSWRLPQAGGFSFTMKTDVLCDGVALPDATVSYLHLTPGTHRVRWQVSMPTYATRNLEDFRQLRTVDFRPMATGSLPEILGSTLNFHEEAPAGAAPFDPVEVWPAATGWRPGSDPAAGGPILEADYGAGILTALTPVPGTVTSRLRMERNGPLGFTVINTVPAAAAPFPWTTWTTSRPPSWPLAEGYRTSAAGVGFTPHTPVSIGEALDQPDLEWTADSSPPGLWKALTGVPASENSDPDGLFLTGMAMGETAWLETTVTGPLEVTTQFGKANRVDIGLRILLDGVPAADESSAGSVLRIPAGSHRLRWEVAPTIPLPLGGHDVIRGVTITAPGGPLPDINDLLDAPQLKWGLIGAVPAAVTGELAHDGVDALNLGTGTGQTVLTLGLEGPGLVSFWMKGHPGLGEPILAGLAVPFARTTPPTPLTAWRKITLPVPAGMHTCQFRGPGLLDEFNWQPLPALTPEEALDAPAGVTVTMPNPTLYGAAAWPDFSDDGTDSLLMLPGQARRLEVNVPPLSTLSLRVRAAFGTGTFGFQDLDSAPTTTDWAIRLFSTPANAGISTVYLRASLAPVLIDRLTVTTPPAVVGYFPWADSHGLATARNQPLDDPDGDGWSNLLEYSLGLNPAAADSQAPGTDTVPGPPETTAWTDPATGLIYPEVRYWRRTGQTSTVETAADPAAAALIGDPAGWTPSLLPGTVTTPGPEGWSRVVWRAAGPVAAGGRVFVRVRYSPF